MSKTDNKNCDSMLGKYFSFYDLTTTQWADLRDKNHKLAASNPKIINNLTMVAHILDYMVDTFGVNIYVTSGFRCPKLNKRVHGSPFSWHKKGRAVDFWTDYKGKINTFEFFHILKDAPHIFFHRLIYYPKKHFIHFSLPTGWRDGKIELRYKDKIDVLGVKNEN